MALNRIADVLISIHAPRAGGDVYPVRLSRPWECHFNPRPPCGGRRAKNTTPAIINPFQSTPPVRGATYFAVESYDSQDNFNPRPPCGGRLDYFGVSADYILFQSTPPVRGATERGLHRGRRVRRFQSTPPVRGATACRWTHSGRCWRISIHAPRAGGDKRPAGRTGHTGHFNPRPPCGGRLPFPSPRDFSTAISIHAPRAGGDAPGHKRLRPRLLISIHAPRAGGDPTYQAQSEEYSEDFNPRPPCGGRRRFQMIRWRRCFKISIHAPRAGGDVQEVVSA